jgi:hypothetical protein
MHLPIEHDRKRIDTGRFSEIRRRSNGSGKGWNELQTPIGSVGS